jgi:hypothetical protein
MFKLGAVIAVEVEMTARIFWILGAGLSVLAMLLMAYGGPEAGAIIDYRAWLLLAFGILVMAIGNFSRTSERDS